MSKTLHIHPKDNVIVALADEDGHKRGHKYATKDIKKGDLILKYGEPIGSASEDISRGAHVHTHNVVTNLGDILDYTYKAVTDPFKMELPDKTVRVYERSNGEIGIRNELWIIPTVGCVNGLAKAAVSQFHVRMVEKGIDLLAYPNFDGIHTFPHSYGCSQMGDDHVNTRETLQNISLHPNAGGVLVFGLGCENNQIDQFFDTLGVYDEDRIKALVAQDSEDEIEAAVDLLEALFNKMTEDVRVEKPISVLNIGLECGGSDGLSGVTANPLVGRFSDYLIHHGGTTVLTEVPEMFGAEQQLMNRCINETVFSKTVDMVNGFKNYYKAHNQVIYDNPSPGNKNGGITTLEDKSLGCTTKSGRSPVMDVLKSTQRLSVKGLNLISAPGNDLIATTTLGMCGCHMVLFTTGRGTPFGGFIPTLKIATNHPMAVKKHNWIDFDAGLLVEGRSMDSLLDDLIDLIIATAEGKETKQEINDCREIAIFKFGVTL